MDGKKLSNANLLERLDEVSILLQRLQEAKAGTSRSKSFPKTINSLQSAVDQLKESLSESGQDDTGAKYRAVMLQSKDCIFLVDVDTRRVIEANPAMCTLLEYSAEEMQQLTLYDFINRSPEDIDAQIGTILEKGQSELGERVYRTKSGQIIPVEVRVTLIRYSGKQAMCVVSRDIRERKEATEKLRASRERYQKLFNNTVDMIFLHSIDMERIIEVNSTAIEFLGYRRDELYRMSPHDVIVPELRHLKSTHRKELLSEGHILFETVLLSKNGDKLPVEINAHLLRMDDDQAVLSVVRPLKSRWESQHRLYRRDAILEAVSLAAEHFMTEENWQKNIRQILQKFGQAAQTSRVYIFQKIVETKSSFVVSQIYEWCEVGIEAQIDNPALQKVDMIAAGYARWIDKLKNNQPVYGVISDFPEPEIPLLKAQAISALAVFPLWASNRLWGFIGFDDCVQERYWSLAEIEAFKIASRILSAAIQQQLLEQQRFHLEQQVHEAQKIESLNTMAGGIAHDFNNILTTILGNAGLALSEKKLPAKIRTFIEQIDISARRAADLSTQMLTYTGRGKYRLELLSLNDILNELRNFIAASVSKKARILFDLSPLLPAISVDAAQIRQVVMNLVMNASESLGNEKGTITISTGETEYRQTPQGGHYFGNEIRPGGYVFLSVRDDGNGIPEKDIHKIFDPYFTTKFTGRGLGLAAVLGIVKAHLGSIQVISSAGKGTEIRVNFLSLSEQAAPERKKRTHKSPAKKPQTILVVDDEVLLRNMAKTYLEQIGFTVVVAGNGKEAAEKFSQTYQTIDLVVMDMTMPELSGEEAYLEMRKVDPKVKVLFTSGYRKEQLFQKIHADERVAFLAKPFRLSDLSMKVNQMLDQPVD